MARKLVVIELALVSCSLLKTLSGKDGQSSHLAQSALIWPRAGIASRFSASRIDLDAGGCDLSTAAWTRRIVFKESVESFFGLKVDITEAIGGEEIEEFLRFMAGTVIGIGADVVDDVVAAGKLASAPLDYLAAKLKKIPEPDVIASGSIDLNSEEIPANHGRLLKVELFSPHEFVKTSRRTVNRKTVTQRRVLMSKAEPNGEVILSARRI